MSFVWFRALRAYAYAMRLDEDCCLLRLPAASLFAALSADYAFGLETTESHRETVETFSPFVRAFLHRGRLVPTIPPLPTDRMYFTNFFVTNVSWWEQPRVRRFLDDVNASGGVYTHRWGDAPIQTAALRLYAERASVRHLAVDYVHWSTQNLIVDGKEVAGVIDPSRIPNAHFRRLAEEAAAEGANRSHTNLTTSSSQPAGTDDPTDAATAPQAGACADVPDSFSTIALCTGSPECAEGVAAGFAILGSGVCSDSIASFAAGATAVGCPFPFSPPADRDAPLYELCPSTCIAFGVAVPGCASSPAPPTPPRPPSPPPMPPLVPGPMGFTTVATTAQLRWAIEATPPNGSLTLFIPPGSTLSLEGSAIEIGAVSVHLASDGEGATLDANRDSRLFWVKGEGNLRLQFLTLANGRTSGNGGAVMMSLGGVLHGSNITVVNASCSASGGAISTTGGTLTLDKGSSIM